jgi:hypothetical protein
MALRIAPLPLAGLTHVMRGLRSQQLGRKKTAKHQLRTLMAALNTCLRGAKH